MKRSMVFMLVAVAVLGSVGLWSRLPVSAEASVHALWIFSDEVSTPAARDTLVQRSAASGVTDLYLSVYRSALNSAGRRMYQDSDIADLIGKAHLHGLAVWAAYGNTDWPAIGCSPSSWPLQRMAEVVAYDTANPTAQFDGVILDVEPPEPQSEAAYQSLLTLYQCTRAFLPGNLQLAAAIRFFWDTAVVFPVGGSVKPVYQHIADLNLDHIVVMGYRDFAGTAACAEGDGLICLDQDEIAYADTLLKSNLILVGLETANCAPSECGPEKVTFYEEGQAALNSEAQLVATHFGGHISFGGFAIHRYNATYLSGLPAWPTENPPPPQGVIVKLLDSQGHGLAGASAQYYDAGWQTIPGSTDASGTLVTGIPTTRGNLTFRMTYAHASKDMAQNVTSNPIVMFQTANVTVELRDSAGNLMPDDTGTVQYYAGGWRTFGATAGGQASKELLPLTYSFSMSYAFARQEKGGQNTATSPTVTFQTAHVTVELRDSAGNLMPDGAGMGTVQYYAGGWRTFGATAGGQASKELLPLTYSFSMNYAFARQEKGGQNIAANPIVTFQTAHVTVELRDSAGNLMPDGTGAVQYYAGGWRTFGTTAGGQASKELLPLTYSFSMNYAFARQEKGGQNVAANPTVAFQTANVTVELRDSAGNLMPDAAGTVQYYAGGWRTFGATAGGQASKELLPLTYSFSMNYAFARQEKGGQNVASTPTVTFQTANVIVELKDSAGALMPDSAGTGAVQYYAGGWRDFGVTVNGQASKELLPLTYSFAMNYAFARQQLNGQDVNANQTVAFQTGQVHSVSGTAVQYYAGGWRSFVQDMQLLPGMYTFRFNDGNPNQAVPISGGIANSIH